MVLVDRGVIPILSKVFIAQEAGAKAVIVVDNGPCSEDLFDCGVLGGLKKVRAKRDEWLRDLKQK